MRSPIDELAHRHNVPLAYVAERLGISVRHAHRVNKHELPLKPTLHMACQQLEDEWKWHGTGFNPGRYHAKKYKQWTVPS